jgi:hypothetical protein
MIHACAYTGESPNVAQPPRKLSLGWRIGVDYTSTVVATGTWSAVAIGV